MLPSPCATLPAAPALLLVVDDHPLFHEGLGSAIQRVVPAWEVQGVETVGLGLERVAAGLQPDLVLIDLMLPDVDGMQALGRFGSLAPWLPRVMMSGRLETAVVQQARAAGASGFISKAWPVARIVASLHAVLEGQVDFSILAELAPPVGEVHLTDRQRVVLGLLARGLPNKAIARELSIADRTVRAHLTELFQALGAASRLQALINARRAGLIDSFDPAP
jgi:DNA-binding NarL/FixJ family response regulator